ncbi:hypothetical protein [Flavobacterium terrisoli]|uniref:hypothetical protein n=1 Tax=Flavobacterium terrisoli TaxID=3242195 RepID=UPI00254287AF|nr:hypothetical protein [Flavobacterium buctense]
MKNTTAVLLMVILAIPPGKAQKNAVTSKLYDFSSGSVITTFNKESTEYRFDSFEDLYNGIDEISKDFIINNPKKSKEPCDISIGVRIEMVDGTEKMIITGAINIDCHEEAVNKATTKLKTMLIVMRDKISE